MTVNVGFIGYRNHAARLMQIIEQRNDCNIKYIFHPTKLIDDKSTNELSDLYSCDAIIIASPNKTHFNYIIQILENSNCKIFCEKPPVTNESELKFIESLPVSKKKQLYFNFNFRFSEINELLNSQLKNNTIGKIIHLNILATHGFAYKQEYRESWRSDGINNIHSILETLTIHYLDLLNLNSIKTTRWIYLPSNVSHIGTSYDTLCLNMESEDNMTISILNSYAAPFINQITIIGTNGYCVIKDKQIEIKSPRETFGPNGVFITPPSIFVDDNFSINDDYKESLVKSIDYFITTVKNNGDFNLKYFQTSILTNRLVLLIKNNYKQYEKS